jgi:hypothetical protein
VQDIENNLRKALSGCIAVETSLPQSTFDVANITRSATVRCDCP